MSFQEDDDNDLEERRLRWARQDVCAVAREEKKSRRCSDGDEEDEEHLEEKTRIDPK